MAHTPGPWAVWGWGDANFEVLAEHTTVCNVPGFADDTVDDSRAEADAKLIAAAPELLAACQLLVALEDNDVHPADTRWKQARKDMRAAITKVEERSE